MVLESDVKKIIEKLIYEKQLVGVSVGVVQRHASILVQGYGYSDYGAHTKSTQNTVYRIGSMTKQFTAVAIMMLVERGEISLSDRLSDVLPDYPAIGHDVSIEHLLNHTSGIKSYTDIQTFWEKSHQDLSQEEVVGLFSGEPRDFLPGERFQYNNSGYYLLGMIIEKITGSTYSEFLKQSIWSPLGMSESYYLGDVGEIDNMAVGYDFKEGEFVEPSPLGMQNPFAGGSLGSSVTDLVKWQKALVDCKLISKSSFEKMVARGKLNSGEEFDYGFGFFLSTMSGHRKIEHGGEINGFRSQFSYYPDDELAVISLCNMSTAPCPQLESQIARLIIGIAERRTEEICLPESTCKPYIGMYQWCSTMAQKPFPVVLRNGKLSIGKRPLLAVADDRFVFSDDPYYEIVFDVEDQNVIGFRCLREGQETRAVRVKSV